MRVVNCSEYLLVEEGGEDNHIGDEDNSGDYGGGIGDPTSVRLLITIDEALNIVKHCSSLSS
jgi:hypothetical protein